MVTFPKTALVVSSTAQPLLQVFKASGGRGLVGRQECGTTGVKHGTREVRGHETTTRVCPRRVSSEETNEANENASASRVFDAFHSRHVGNHRGGLVRGSGWKNKAQHVPRVARIRARNVYRGCAVVAREQASLHGGNQDTCQFFSCHPFSTIRRKSHEATTNVR